ncbi:MAG: ribosome maturation factor RimP [Bacteroidota bacterium]
MNLKATVEELVNQILVAHERADELFLVEVQVAGNTNGHLKVMVLLDGDQGIAIDACAQISRRLAHQIEELNLLEAAYVLEVSSPGLDTPLRLKRQYTKNIGRKIKVLLGDASSKTGTLHAVEDEGILLEEEISSKKKSALKDTVVAPIRIAWQDISKTNVLVSF